MGSQSVLHRGAPLYIHRDHKTHKALGIHSKSPSKENNSKFLYTRGMDHANMKTISKALLVNHLLQETAASWEASHSMVTFVDWHWLNSVPLHLRLAIRASDVLLLLESLEQREEDVILGKWKLV